MAFKYIIAIASILFCIETAFCQNVYYVSNSGSDNHPGTLEKPFMSIQKAVNIMKPGDVCRIRGGIYTETVNWKSSGQNGKPIRIEAYNSEKVTIDGTEEVKGHWEEWKPNIYKTKIAADFEQLFVGRKMMTEARWPNSVMPQQLWDRSFWAESDEGSSYGQMIDAELSATGIDWTGAVAVLNVAHQFRSWTRKVLSHDMEANTFTYKKNLNTITSYAEGTKGWGDDLYYLTGKLEALDAPGEWYLDKDTKTLYVYEEGNINENKYRYKVRNYGLLANKVEHIEISDIHFFGATLRLLNCNHTLIENCKFEYPVYTREFNDPEAPQRKVDTYIEGNDNRIIRNHISYSQRSGMVVLGVKNHVENNVVHDVGWTGQGFGILITSTGKDGFVVTRNTVYNTGYTGIRPEGYGSWEASYNHVHHTAMIAKDCAAIQTGSPKIGGSTIHHNWIHDCETKGKHPAGLSGGLGIRGDDQTRSLTVHHNVVWNIGRDGIIVKGNHNKIYNNTVFSIGSNGKEGNYISMHTEPEPYKPWREQAPLLPVQNQNSMIFNNIALNIVGDRKRTPFPFVENLSTNYYEKTLPLSDPENFDFSPKAASSLIDAGTFHKGLTDNYKGEKPDIGAYEFGDDWKAGADWDPSEVQNANPVIRRIIITEEAQGQQGVIQKIVRAYIKKDTEDLVYAYRIVSGNATLEQVGDYAILQPHDDSEVVIELKITNSEGLSATKTTSYADVKVAPEKLYTDKATWMVALGSRFKNHESFSFRERDESLPNVLIIGNSISIGYTPYVQEALQGKCNVYRIPENGGDTKKALAKLDLWLGDNDWDVIHFNFGLHDLKRLKNNKLNIEGEVVNTEKVYASNLKKIVKKLKKASDAKLVWATTSVVPEGAEGRIKGTEVTYNRIAEKIMKRNGISIDDQYALTSDHPDDQMKANVHFLEKGRKRQAKQVVKHIVENL